MGEIKNKEALVRKILEMKPKSKDSDALLLAIFWAKEIGDFELNGPTPLTAKQFLQRLAMGDTSNPISIWRCRQKLQEKYELLRGDKYQVRQKHSKKVKEEIIKWDDPENQKELF